MVEEARALEGDVVIPTDRDEGESDVVLEQAGVEGRLWNVRGVMSLRG